VIRGGVALRTPAVQKLTPGARQRAAPALASPLLLVPNMTAAVLAAVLAAELAAPARPVAPTATNAATTPSSPQPGEWYGAPAGVVDTGAFLVMAAGSAAGNTTMFLSGFVAFMVGGPVNHVVNGHGGRAAASLAIRLLAAGLSFGVLYGDLKLGDCLGDATCHDHPTAVAVITSGLALTAMVLDDGLLAREPDPPPPRRRSWSMAVPGLAVSSGGAMLSVGGRF
jgi:hypothetical protein